MEIFVDNRYGKNFTVRLGASDRLRDLKAKIEAKTSVRSSDQRVSYAGTLMRMNWRLSAYGLRDGCTVYLGPLGSLWDVGGTGARYGARFGSGYGGGSPICFDTFVDLENKDALQRIPINHGTRRRCTAVSMGLNIEWKCTNMSCEAFGRRVISPIYFHPFDIVTDKARCPMCRCTVEVTTCGFVECQWMFTGRKKGSDVDIMSEWQLAGDDEYERFREADEKDRLACGCRFHSNCVAQWNEHETGCPNCSREESTSQSPMEVIESKPKTCPVEVIESKPKTRRRFWRLCQD